MSLDNISEGSLSDDEIFFGKVTLKEVKKCLFRDNQQKQCSASVVNSPKRQKDHNTSLKILQAHSEPNLLSNRDGEICNQDNSGILSSGWDMREDDSFIKLESMVEKMYVSPTLGNNKNTEELNNTLEVIEYILTNPPSGDKKLETVTDVRHEEAKLVIKPDNEVLNEYYLKKLHNISPQKIRKVEKPVARDSPEPPQNTPVKTEKKYVKEAGYITPVDTKHKPGFKTPAQPLLLKKPSVTSLKKTSCKTNAYQHISSPVASYIKNCPIAPLLKDVHPKKPLPGPSSIPKFKNAVSIKKTNKENFNLPPVAYKSAKKTKLIDMPDEQKLPECQWAKKLMGSLPRPVVIKHGQRELNIAKKKLLPQQEDSFANLSYHQAEVSVCSQKSAFKVNKNI